MTVVTIVLVSIVAAAATVIVFGLMGSTKYKAKCENCGGFWKDETCYVSDESTQTIKNYDACE